MKIAVAGGTGTVGRHVVAVARERGHEVAVLSRATGVDVLTGEGLASALVASDVVVDALNSPRTSGRAATRFFTDTARNLQLAAAGAGVERIVLISIVGIDRAEFGYYRAKLAHEREHKIGPVPITILRATQFHEFPALILARLRLGPFAFVPHMRTQTVAARTVAEHVIDAALAPRTEALQVGGPEQADMVDLARRYAAHRGQRLRVVPVRVPGAGGRAMRDGTLLPGPEATLAGPTFDEWLATKR